jgi:hypothetical protein
MSFRSAKERIQDILNAIDSIQTRTTDKPMITSLSPSPTSTWDDRSYCLHCLCCSNRKTLAFAQSLIKIGKSVLTFDSDKGRIENEKT